MENSAATTIALPPETVEVLHQLVADKLSKWMIETNNLKTLDAASSLVETTMEIAIISFSLGCVAEEITAN